MCTSNLEVKPKPHIARKRILLLPPCFAKKVISHMRSVCQFVSECYMSGAAISSANKYPISVMSGRGPNHLEEDVVNKDVFNNMCTRRVFQGRQVFLKEFP